jgi:hypothetical protein
MCADDAERGWRRPDRRPAGAFFRRLAVPVLAACLFSFPPKAAGRPAEEAPALSIAVAKDSFFYSGSEEARFRVSLENHGDKAAEGLDLLFKLYRPCRSRQELAEVREGKSRYIANALYVGRELKLEPGNTDISFAMDLASWGVEDGAWPFRLELQREGKELAETRGYVLVSRVQSGMPLKVVPLWDVHYPPLQDARGEGLDGSLADACSDDSSGRGFLFSLFRAMEAHPGVRSALALSGLSGEQLGMMAAGGIEGGAASSGATYVLERLKGLWRAGRVEPLSSTYGYADLARLMEERWSDDAREQLLRGGNALAVLLQGSTPAGFFPPLYSMHPEVPGMLAGEGVSYTLTTETYLASAEQKGALSAARSGYPVRLDAGEGRTLDAMVVDASLYKMLEEWDREKDPEGRVLLDDIMAETFVIQKEKPAEKRLCLVAFPDSFRPDDETIDRLYDELELMPWLETSTPSEALSAVPPREEASVKVGYVEEEVPPYFAELRRVRELALLFRQALMEDNPLADSLYGYVMTAEAADLYEGYPSGAGARYLDSVSATVRGGLGNIAVAEQGSVTLSSTQGELTVVVNNLNPYPVKARISLAGRGVDFPQGDSREVVLEPQENSFSFPVATAGKGGFLVDVELSCGGLEVSKTVVSLRTSNINTLSIIFLVVLLGLLAAVWALKKMRHWGRRGKHERA